MPVIRNRYSYLLLLFVHQYLLLFVQYSSLFDYLFHFSFEFFFYCWSKRKRTILTLNPVQVFRSCVTRYELPVKKITCVTRYELPIKKITCITRSSTCCTRSTQYLLTTTCSTSSSSRVNKHHTADSTHFVLV